MSRTAPDLHQNLVLDPTIHPVPRRIVEAITRAIEDGSLVDDDLLPSSRRMAEAHGVARSAVVEAYETLCGLGLAHASQGSGTRIARGARDLLGSAACRDPDRTGFTVGRIRHCVNLTVPAGVDKSVINARDWNRAWREAISPAEVDAGTAQLAAALADHLRSFRGVVFEHAQLVLRPSIGSAIGDIVHGLDLRGRGVAIEDPGYPRIQRHFLNEGCRVHCIPVDDQGLRIDMLTPDDKVVHVTPARQWPTGVAMSLERRQELLAWAEHTGGVIIENDLDAEFTYGHAPLPTLYSMTEGRARVLYVGSSSKLITPELGVVWLVVDECFRKRAVDVAPVSDFSARALANYIQSGAMYRHRNRALVLFEERRCALLNALSEFVPEVSTLGDPSGTELAIRLPEGVDEFIVQLRLEEAGYQVSTLGDFAIRRQQHALLLQYGDLTPVDAQRFAHALARALDTTPRRTSRLG